MQQGGHRTIESHKFSFLHKAGKMMIHNSLLNKNADQGNGCP